MEKNCEICNKLFEPKRNDSKFCSQECFIINKNLKRKKEPIIFKCLICEKEFIQKRKDNITCSGHCAQKLWVKNNPDKDWERHNGNEAKKRQKNWIKENYQKFRDIQNKYKRNRRKKDLNYKINYLMGNSIRSVLKNKNNNRWIDLTGYDVQTLINHLETTLPIGITWDDYLKGGYHIDHIIPQSLYDYDTYDDEFKKCWSHRNLRILPGDENLEKLAKYDNELVMYYNITDLLPKDFLVKQ